MYCILPTHFIKESWLAFKAPSGIKAGQKKTRIRTTNVVNRERQKNLSVNDPLFFPRSLCVYTSDFIDKQSPDQTEGLRVIENDQVQK